MSAQRKRTQRRTAIDLLGRRGVMRRADLIDAGIHGQTLARLVEEGIIFRPSRGIYQLSNSDITENHAFAEAIAAAPNSVVCLLSAMRFHGITVQRPREVWLAISRKAREPKVTYPPVRFAWFTKDAMSIGIEHHKISGVRVPIFNPAKTVVDGFRYRNKIGRDVAIEALREAIRKRLALPDQILDYAEQIGPIGVLRPHLDTVLANG